MVDGSDDDMRRAEAILSHRGIEDWGIYDAPATNTTTTRTSDIADPSATYQTPVVDPTPRTDSPVQIIDRREQTL
jgi:hypothetical protein